MAVAAFVLYGNTVLAQESQYRLLVDGLACPFCAYGIEKQLLGLDRVTDVETQIKEGAVVVTLVDDASLSEDRARQAVRDAGFTLNGFERIAP